MSTQNYQRREFDGPRAQVSQETLPDPNLPDPEQPDVEEQHSSQSTQCSWEEIPIESQKQLDDDGDFISSQPTGTSLSRSHSQETLRPAPTSHSSQESESDPTTPLFGSQAQNPILSTFPVPPPTEEDVQAAVNDQASRSFANGGHPIQILGENSGTNLGPSQEVEANGVYCYSQESTEEREDLDEKDKSVVD